MYNKYDIHVFQNTVTDILKNIIIVQIIETHVIPIANYTVQ